MSGSKTYQILPMKTNRQLQAEVRLKGIGKWGKKVLMELYDIGEEYSVDFKFISEGTKIPRKNLSKVMKPLREAGLVLYARGLINEDGDTMGSGYQITEAGMAVCDNMPYDEEDW